MDRLLFLKTTELNYSMSSELGYETAIEDSQLSLYYSISNDSLDKTIEGNIESNVPLIDAQNASTVPTTSSNHSINSTSSIESFENVEMSVAPNESTNLSEHLSASSASPSIARINTIEDIAISNSDSTSAVLLSDIETDSVNQMNVDSRSETTSPALNGQCSSSENINRNNVLVMETQQDTTEVTVLQPATLQPTSIVTRGSKARQTSVRFHSADDAEVFIPRKTTSTNQRTVLSSWNSLSRRTIFPKPILKKTASFDQPIKNTLHSTINDTPNPSRPQTRSSTFRKSIMPRQSTYGSANPSGLARKEFITAKGNLTCQVCNKKFLLKSTLMSHEMEHKNEKSQNNCKYCDRSFKKSIALSMHLKENCEKIPSAARKKILIGDFNKLTK